MSFVDVVRGFTNRMIRVVGFRSGSSVKVVDSANTPPTLANIPRRWTSTFMGPGQPMGGGLWGSTARGKDVEAEPRTFEYAPNVNATISPRLAYGLTAFTELRRIAESVPEVSMCIRIITEEIKSFTPRIIDPDGNECKDLALKWMYTEPDRFNPWPVWISRFLYNVLVYDAGAIYRQRVGGKISSLRVIDGSTIFVLVDESGEQPMPPAPAFSQVIHGIPRNFLNTYQLWYRPRHLRADAPYGRSPIEDALPAITLLANLWDYEGKWYTEGNIPEVVMTSPPNWQPDQILEYETAFNSRMAGNSAERAGRIRFLPGGTESIAIKDAKFREDVYQAAANVVRMAFGIPQTEVGESPGTGLGGTGFLEAMQNLFYRLTLAPMKAYVESLFNETLEENGYKGYSFELAFPKDTIDPSKEEEKATERFAQGLVTRDEARQALGLSPLGGEQGAFLIDPGGGQQDPFGGMFGGAQPGNRFSMAEPENGKVKVNSKIPLKVPVHDMGRRVRVADLDTVRVVDSPTVQVKKN